MTTPASSTNPWGNLSLSDHLEQHEKRLHLYTLLVACVAHPEQDGEAAIAAEGPIEMLLWEEAFRAGVIRELFEEEKRDHRGPELAVGD